MASSSERVEFNVKSPGVSQQKSSWCNGTQLVFLPLAFMHRLATPVPMSGSRH